MKRLVVTGAIAGVLAGAAVSTATAGLPTRQEIVTRTRTVLAKRIRFIHAAATVRTVACQQETQTAWFCIVHLTFQGAPVTFFYNVALHGNNLTWTLQR